MRLFAVWACLSLSACAGAQRDAEPGAAPVSPAPPAARAPAPDPLTASVTEFLAGPTAAGASVAVLIRQGTAESYASTAGLPRNRPFWIGSLTKPVTAAAVLKLEEQGKLSVSNAITRFFPDAPADKRAITLHHLLTHTSGLPHEYASEGVTDRAAAVRAVLALPLSGRPGAAAKYSSDGYSLLAVIVEQASGMSYEQYLQTQILQPAGMSNTGFWPGAAARIAVAQRPSPKNARPNWGFRGATGLYASADDLLRFTAALREGRLLSRATVALAMGPRFERAAPASDIGYGWFLSERDGAPLITHSGAEDGLQHFGWVYVFPETDQTAVILISGVTEDRAGDIRTGVLKRLPAPQPAAQVRPSLIEKLQDAIG